MDKSSSKSVRLGWTPQEQQFIKELYQVNQILNWNEVSKQLNDRFKVNHRSAKQCRQRYSNYIRFGADQQKNVDWKNDQDQVLFLKYAQIGSLWGHIATFLPGKSQNCIKNRFYGSLRRLLRKINNVQKLYKIKSTYPIKYDSILKILQIVKLTQTGINNIKQQQFLQLRNQILNLAKTHEQEKDEIKIINLIKSIHQLSPLTRFISINKGKKKNILNKGKLSHLLHNSRVKNNSEETIHNEPTFQNHDYNQCKDSWKQELLIVDDMMIIKQDKQSTDLELQLSLILKKKYNPTTFDFIS